jgi:hypothetical protein
VPHAFVVLAVATVAFSSVFFLLADYGWESRKRHQEGRDFNAYAWYSWFRYLAIILLTYLNASPLFSSENPLFFSAARTLYMISLVVLLSIAFLRIDRYWDRQLSRSSSRVKTLTFWIYFWLRYPALIAATIQATRRGWV